MISKYLIEEKTLTAFRLPSGLNNKQIVFNSFYETPYLASSSLPLAISHLGDSGMKYIKTRTMIQGAETNWENTRDIK